MFFIKNIEDQDKCWLDFFDCGGLIDKLTRK